ncbi:MAG TPA: hypothetical protein VGM63_02495 [Mucilaginibacter sp.]|jgi:hypothetical protein
MKNLFIISAFILVSVFKVSAQDIVPAKYAAKHVGHKVTICDKIFNTGSNSEATSLYLAGDYPNQLLTIIIKTGDLAKFKGHPANDLKGKEICVTGVVTLNKGKAEITVSSPNQIKPFMVDSPVGKQKF